jgi:uncharacterized membrane protein
MAAGGSGRAGRLLTDRMEAFSDGVFAIAITLLVLEITIPADRSDLLRAVIEEWPVYLGYLVSFFTIGAVWMAHSAITEFLEHVDPILLRINLVLLMVVGLLPVPTRLMADYIQSSSGERVAVTIYGLVLLSTRLMVLALWQYGVRHDLVRPDLADDHVQGVSAKLAPSLGGYAVALAVGLIAPLVAVGLYLAIALYLVIPFRELASLLGRRARPRSS